MGRREEGGSGSGIASCVMGPREGVKRVGERAAVCCATMYVHDRIVSGIGWDGVLHLMIDWKSALQKSGKSALRKLPSQLHDNRLEKVFDINVASVSYTQYCFFSPRGNTKE